MEHVRQLVEFFQSLELEELRVERPAPFIFFCGGSIGRKRAQHFSSLRDYILRRPLNIRYRFVLAEDAVDLFKESHYSDLIEFEAHIAEISELVLLICESAGSLAELGAFCRESRIAERLYVIVQEKYLEEDSFVRLGPLRVLAEKDSDSVGAFPWKLNSKRQMTALRAFRQYDDDIIQAIESRLRHTSEKFLWENCGHRMILIYWICFILRSATLKEILEFFRLHGFEIKRSEIRKFVYCMKVAGWLEEINIGSAYYVPCFDKDPFEYAYKIKDRSNLTRSEKVKTDIGEIIIKQRLRPKKIQDCIGASEQTTDIPLEAIPEAVRDE